MSAVVPRDDRPVDPDDELLVAYLDGELDLRSRSGLEQRLLHEESLRKRLQELQRGWDLLDELPEATPNEKLVESTLELVVADLTPEPTGSDSLASRFRFPLSVAAASLLAAILAVGGVWAWGEHRYQQQLRDLALAEHFDAYTKGRDLQLMDQLHRSAAWKQTIQQAIEVGRIQPRAESLVADTPVSERAERIRNLSADQRQTLASRWNRFLQTPAPQRQQLRATAAKVQAQVHADALLETMRQYAVWRESLPPELVDRVESSDPAVRAPAIEQAVALTQQRIVGRSRSRLSEEAVWSIHEALEQIMLERIERVDPSGEMSRVARLRQRITRGRGASFWLGVHLRLLGDPPPGSPGRHGSEPHAGEDDGGEDDGRADDAAADDVAGNDAEEDEGREAEREALEQLREPLTDAELEWIEFALPERDRENLDSIAMLSPLTRELTLRAWAEEAIVRRLPGGPPHEASVLERYRALDPEQRAWLDLIPVAEWPQRLFPHRPGPGRPSDAGR